jgi:hypothetical protein
MENISLAMKLEKEETVDGFKLEKLKARIYLIIRLSAIKGVQRRLPD